MLNVLLITYVFPPVGGVGVLRAASLARYLPAEGIRLDVITTRNASAVGADPTLLSDISAEVRIHRTITLDIPFGIKKGIKKLVTGTKIDSGKSAGSNARSKPGLLKRILGDVLLPDPQVTWLPVLSRAARSIIRERNIDVVLITVPPFSSVLLVEKLRKDFPHLPIVVDFRDEWLSTTIKLVSFSSSERAITVAREAEATCVKNATTVVAVTEAARREIRGRYPEQPDSKFQFISNGFDGTRVHSYGTSTAPQRGERIVITYLGSIYGSTEPTTLVRALESLPADVRSRFTLRFIGHIEEPRFREALLGLGDMIDLRGYLPQHEAFAAMDETDYFLLISHDPLNVSAKFYDYIGAGKPILACIHPQGDVRRLLEELRAGWWADSRDAAAIRQLFLDAAARCDSLRREFQPDIEKIAQYERRILAQRYAELLHCIAGRTYEANLHLPAEISEERSV
jgi:hypothetical protein